MLKRIIYILVGFMGCWQAAQAQRHELGLHLGTTFYTGELSKVPELPEFRYGGYLTHHLNISNPLGLRTNLGLGFLSASDTYVDQFSERRNAEFTARFFEFSTGLVYHFLDYRPRESWIRWSPYLYLGAGVASVQPNTRSSILTPVVPMGVGFKYKLYVDLDIGIEYCARLTFSDQMDGLTDSGSVPQKNFQWGNSSTPDWYHFIGFTISYRWYRILCPQDFDEPYYRKPITGQ